MGLKPPVGQLRLGTSGLGFLSDGSCAFTRGRLWPCSSLETPETWSSNPRSDSCDWAPPDLGFCRTAATGHLRTCFFCRMVLVFLQWGDCGHVPPSRRPKPGPRIPGRTAATGHLRTLVFAGWDLGFLPKGRLWPSSSLEMPETWAPSPWSESCDWAPPDLGLCWMGLVFSKGETAAMYLSRVARNLALESPVGQLRLDTSGLVFFCWMGLVFFLRGDGGHSPRDSIPGEEERFSPWHFSRPISRRPSGPSRRRGAGAQHPSEPPGRFLADRHSPCHREASALYDRRGSDRHAAQTNPPVRGRVSADRSEEAAQPLTTPRLVRKSSTDDSVRLHCMWGLRAFGRCDAGFPRRRRVPLAWAEKGRLEAVP